jgi:hypothetical protein
MEATLRGD